MNYGIACERPSAQELAELLAVATGVAMRWMGFKSSFTPAAVLFKPALFR